MVRAVTIKIMINEDGTKIATIEDAIGLPQDKIDSHLIIIGLLENLKQKHLDKMKTLFNKTIKKGDKDIDL